MLCFIRGAFRFSLPEETIDKRSAKSFIRINDRIRAREVRVIDETGDQLGILAPFEALKDRARARTGPGGGFAYGATRRFAAFRITASFFTRRTRATVRRARSKR